MQCQRRTDTSFGNPLVGRRELEIRHKMHRENISKIKSVVDTRPPAAQPHLTLYGRDYVAKKKATTEAAFSDLKMIQSIARTMTRAQDLPERRGPVSLNADGRKQEIYRIMQENHRMCNSLDNLPATVDTRAMIKDHKWKQRYVINASHTKRLTGEYDDDTRRIKREDTLRKERLDASIKARLSNSKGLKEATGTVSMPTLPGAGTGDRSPQMARSGGVGSPSYTNTSHTQSTESRRSTDGQRRQGGKLDPVRGGPSVGSASSYSGSEEPRWTGKRGASSSKDGSSPARPGSSGSSAQRSREFDSGSRGDTGHASKKKVPKGQLERMMSEDIPADTVITDPAAAPPKITPPPVRPPSTKEREASESPAKAAPSESNAAGATAGPTGPQDSPEAAAAPSEAAVEPPDSAEAAAAPADAPGGSAVEPDSIEAAAAPQDSPEATTAPVDSPEVAAAQADSPPDATAAQADSPEVAAAQADSPPDATAAQADSPEVAAAPAESPEATDAPADPPEAKAAPADSPPDAPISPEAATSPKSGKKDDAADDEDYEEDYEEDFADESMGGTGRLKSTQNDFEDESNTFEESKEG